MGSEKSRIPRMRYLVGTCLAIYLIQLFPLNDVLPFPATTIQTRLTADVALLLGWLAYFILLGLLCVFLHKPSKWRCMFSVIIAFFGPILVVFTCAARNS